jgi:hypothetical protein
VKALSIRQPWAWVILNGGKDIENRTWKTDYRGEFLIHASKTMTRSDYEAAYIFCCGLPAEFAKFTFPSFDEMLKQRGGIVGKAKIIDCVRQSNSPWFCGDYGFMLTNPEPVPFRPLSGKLHFFEATL